MNPERELILQIGMARPSPAVNETAHVADSQRSFGPAVQALAHDSQRRRLLLLNAPEAAVRNSVDIDASLSRAIVLEIGERLRAILKEDQELPAQFKAQIERLRQKELGRRTDKVPNNI